MAVVQKRSHERLRIPEQWKGQDRQFVIQLERILDDVYNGKADAENTKQAIASLTASVESLDSDKLDKSNVYNGLDKTAFGFALDARQGEVLSDIGSTIQGTLAIIANGDTHIAISSGEYVFVKNNTHGLADGLYQASANVAANGAISSSNMTTNSKGGFNAITDTVLSLFDYFSVLQAQLDFDGMINAIKARATSDIMTLMTTSAVNTTLYGSSVSLNGITMIYKASSNNAYFLMFSRDAAAIGNISLANNNVSVRHVIV